jgi:hypothetical protein
MPRGISGVAVLRLAALSASHYDAAGWMGTSERIATIAPTRLLSGREPD